MKRILILFLAVFTLNNLSAQERTVRGVVKNEEGGLPFVSVTEKGVPGNGVSTNAKGEFSLALRGSSNTLVFDHVGYASREVNVAGKASVEVLLQISQQSMNDVIVIGYGTKKRVVNTGAVSSISAALIRNVPTSSVQNALSGRVPGIITVQRSGQPGRDASDFFIRGLSSLNPDGNKPLIIVDDVEYTYEQLSQINVNEIENISILKDASTTAIYGLKGANGVLVVTTRRGTTGKPKINVRVESGSQSPVTKLKFLNAYRSALLVNEALTNDGLPVQFSQTDLDHFRTGDDPYGHPDINWYEKTFKPYSIQANTNLDISGGNEVVRYFISGGAFIQNGNLRNFSDPEEKVNTNYFYRRFNLRTNLDVRVTKSLNMRLDMSSRFGDINQPHAKNIVSEIYDYSKIRPFSAPFINPNGSYAFASDTKSQLATINSRLATGGYDRQKRTDFNMLLNAKQQLERVTKGLSFTAQLAYGSVEQNTRQVFRGDPPSYRYNPADGSYTLNGNGQYALGNYAIVGNPDAYNSNVDLQLFFNYDRVIRKNHFSSMLLYKRTSYNDDRNAQPAQKFQGYSLKLGYDYDQRYLFDLNIAYNGSDRFKADRRYGLFPALGLGWNISKEKFFMDNKALSFVDLMKFRATIGTVGSDVVPGNRYLYNQVYNAGGAYNFGENFLSAPTLYEGSLGNANVTWEVARKLDLGIDLNLFKDKIAVQFDYFYDVRYDQLIYKGSIPVILGVGTAPVNLGKVRNSGFDGQVTYRDRVGNLSYNITGTFTIAKNKVLFKDETRPAYPWLAATGHPIDQPFGYTAIGFYQSYDEINDPKTPRPNSAFPIQPGDIKYKDLNEDGIIDQFDMSAIGKPNTPNTNLGLNLGINYKGFSVNVLFQGAFNYSFFVKGTGIEPFQSQFQPIHEMRWTPDNTDALFPRLSSNATTVNSPAAYPSTFWLLDAHYIRLKTVDLGYQVPQKWLPARIDNARIYFSAYNLFTWRNYSLYQQDPEVTSNTAGDAYMNQRVINLGLQIGF